MSLTIEGTRVLRDGELVGIITSSEAKAVSIRERWPVPVIVGTAEDARAFFSEKVDATPAAVEKAAERGIDLADVKGSGAGGRITVSDLP